MIWITLISAILLVASKLCDVLTTLKYVGVNGEGNPLVRRLMVKYGFKTTCWAVFGLVVLVALGCVAAACLGEVSAAYLIVADALMLIISVDQFAVARYNVTHKENALIRLILRSYGTLFRY